MNWATRFFTLASLMILVGLGFILPAILDEIIMLARIFIYVLVLIFISAIIPLYLMWHEKYQMIKSRRRLSELEMKAAKYRDFQDGFGMLHLLNLETDRVENLSTYPGSHHNGIWEEPPESARLAWFALVARNGEVVNQALSLPATTQQSELLPILDSAERVLIKGASDAGKTTLIQHIASRATDEIIIIDPHYAPGVWPTARIVGAGRNYTEISKLFDWLESELNSRYKMRMVGNLSWTRYTIIIDEYMSVAAECDNAKSTLSMMVRESRKVGFRLFICSHSELLKPLGLDGQGDVREGLLIVRLYYSQLKKERSSTLDDGNGEIPVHFPPYFGNGSAELQAPDMITQLSEQEQKVSEMLATGKSRSAIAIQLFGYAGGNQLAQVDRIIAKIST